MVPVTREQAVHADKYVPIPRPLGTVLPFIAD